MLENSSRGFQKSPVCTFGIRVLAFWPLHLRLRAIPFHSQHEVYSLPLLGEIPAGEVLYLIFAVHKGIGSREQLTLQLSIGYFTISLTERCSHYPQKTANVSYYIQYIAK